MKRFGFILCMVLALLAVSVCEDDLAMVQKKATAGDAAAQAKLGHMYVIGANGLYKDTHEAVNWFTKSANQGNADGEYYLGGMYELGLGVPKDVPTAMKWFDLAAKQGQLDAEYRLARIYDLGKGVPQNSAMAAKYYLAASNKPRPDLTATVDMRLAQMYETGEGVKQDYVESMKWYLKLGDTSFEAQYKIGYFYQHGLGVPADRQQALKWYHKSADQRYGMAIDALKEMDK
jgi:hypothetical protein